MSVRDCVADWLSFTSGGGLMPEGLYSGFDEYRVLKAEDIVEALKSGLVSVDTNVLLSLYRYNEVTANDLLSVLEVVSENIVIPHQVVREFWRNRQLVISDLGSASKEAQTALAKNERSTLDALRRWALSVALPAGDRELLERDTEQFYKKLLDGVKGAPSKVLAETPTEDDALLGRIEKLAEGRVLPKLSDAEWDEAVREGERRVENRLPPGYMDVEKMESELPEGASGDYLVWVQLVDAGRRRNQDLVLVTSDVKEDWWNRGKFGAVVGPRHELIGEYLEATGRRFFLLEPSDLLKYSERLNVSTSPGSVADVQRVRDEIPLRSPWNIEAYRAVLEALTRGGYTQASVIEEALECGGRIARERVYELDGRDESQMLRAFTRPVTRITAELQNEGVVPPGVSPLLRAIYDEGVKTSHFAVPQEVVDLFNGESKVRARVE